MSAGRFDGAGYLAGYAIECILKTLIRAETSRGVFTNHNITRLSREAAQLASMPSQKTAKYVKLPSITKISYATPPTGWKETMRYEAPGLVSSQLAKEWVEEARRLYTEVIVQMKLDGVPL